MRNKKLWKNLMLVTTLTVALGTVSATALAEDDVTLAGGTQVTAFASEGDIDGGIAVEAQAEQTAPEAEVAPEAATTDAEATTPEATVPEADTTDAEAIVPEEVAPEATAPEVEQAEQTAPEATAPETGIVPETEVSAPEVKAVTVDVTASSQTFDGTQDIVITYTVNGVQDGFEPYQDIPWFDGKTGVKEEKVSSTVYKFTIPTTLQQYVIEQNGATDGQTFVFDSKYSTGAVDFPTVTLTYTTGDNGNGETPEKPENPDPDNGNGGNGNGETPEKPENPDPENPDNGGDNGDNQKPENPDPENPDNGNGDNNGDNQNPDNGGDNGDNQKPENPDNGNGDNQNPDGDNSETPDDNKDVQDWMTLTPAQKVTTTTQTQTPQTQTVSTTQTAPKTGDAASTLPLLGTGLTSLGVALGAIFKKRR
ncbi:hypothetical protein CDL26_01395 [Mediterraneibacter gnavus]|uniref:LPXTG cell wall anchor domain-containing protein n=1 Tax=Mediterraneibacter gnavus TaxID=33038 RepID=A0A2N5PHX3_MEDGN|nr:hypothetical protein [Mediterraneibacter gnavus]PLT74751.1 hypothetical protein CDL26_01395 [Mediterraneibacter gnavus]